MEEKILKTPDGELWYGWRKDLEEEEEEGYIPDGYSKRVLELSLLKVKKPGQGFGDELMKAFLDTPEAKKAELIFLDPNPGIGVNFKSKQSEEEQVARLVKFYQRYGFRHNPRSATKRMWLVRKGSIPDHELPT
jgi:GNAT superfamily N-acetyltransferase